MMMENEFLKNIKRGIDFRLNQNLIYYLNYGNRRLCVFSLMEFFYSTRNENMHAEVHRCFNRLIDIFYIPSFFFKFRRYIQHCSNCQFTQKKKIPILRRVNVYHFSVLTVPYYND